MKYCVYFFVDPETQIPFYVGSGLKTRPHEHFCNCNLNKNTRKNNKIKKILKEGFSKEQIIDSFYFSKNRQDCLDIEQMYIDLLKSYNNGGILSNVSLTVDCVMMGRKFSEESRRKMSLSHIGKKLSQEQKDKIGKSSKGNKYRLGSKPSVETINKIKAKITGVKQTKLHVARVARSRSKISIGKKLLIQNMSSFMAGVELSKIFNIHTTTVNRIKHGDFFDYSDILASEVVNG